jgi:hypothetical protein
MRGGGWRLDGDQRDDDDCDNLCEDVSELEAHTRLQESNWELSEHQFDDDYDDGWSTMPTPEGVRRRPGQYVPQFAPPAFVRVIVLQKPRLSTLGE